MMSPLLFTENQSQPNTQASTRRKGCVRGPSSNPADSGGCTESGREEAGRKGEGATK